MARFKQRPSNPISAAVEEWLAQYQLEISAETFITDFEGLVPEAPKRWVHYEPMILLPSGSFTSPLWSEILAKVPSNCIDDLWKTVLRRIGQKSPGATTHLAVNDGIPLTVAATAARPGSEDDGAVPPRQEEDEGLGEDKENILRSPIGLRILYGDFGPPGTSGQTVTDEDFDTAFWASTKQNGIHQRWAPRWTMFSRGNVKEKARLLAFHEPASPQQTDRTAPQLQLQHRVRPRAALAGTWAVDLFAGIGYFVFSYAKLGMRVLCWELNPWSVEGLRRGAEANGWSVKVVKGHDLNRPTPEVVSETDHIVVFLENNQEAARRVQELRSHGLGLQVAHVNCGLLPRSDDSWEAARGILGGEGGEANGWLHLHENVGVKDIEGRRGEIQGIFDGWNEQNGDGRIAKVEHVELVKTFAPDVWHCVFDIYIIRCNINNASR